MIFSAFRQQKKLILESKFSLNFSTVLLNIFTGISLKLFDFGIQNFGIRTNNLIEILGVLNQ